MFDDDDDDEIGPKKYITWEKDNMMRALMGVRNSQLKICPTTLHEGAWGERRYSSYSPRHQIGVSGQRHSPAAL
jgi:hypothetical protein